MFDRPEEDEWDRFFYICCTIQAHSLWFIRYSLSPVIGKLYLDRIVIVRFKYDRFVVILDCSGVDKVKIK